MVRLLKTTRSIALLLAIACIVGCQAGTPYPSADEYTQPVVVDPLRAAAAMPRGGSGMLHLEGGNGQ